MEGIPHIQALDANGVTVMPTLNLKPASVLTTARWVLLMALVSSQCAMAQTDPTLDQVSQAAQAGRVAQALPMVQPVLHDHPDSARAHYVEAELLARQGQIRQAQDELGAADRLAPGLPFARPEAVRQLRSALMSGTEVTHAPMRRDVPARGGSLLTSLLLAVGGGALVAWLLTRLGRPAVARAQPAFNKETRPVR